MKIKNKIRIDNTKPNHDNKLLVVDNLAKEFGKKEKKVKAIKGISFTIYEGQNVALLGSNGAGKTATVEILVGINKPTSGKINYYLSDRESDKLKHIGIQFQDSTYPSHLSVKSIIRFIKDAYHSKLTDKQLNEMIDQFGIKSFYKNHASSLSGGQRQRLNILLALLHKPKLVILDELSTGLDINIRNQIKKFIKQYCNENNMTILIISHDVNEISYLADRLIIMDKGKIVVDVLKDQLIKEKLDLEEFITKYI